MAGRKLTVIVSQAPGKNPNKRQLEEEIATRLMLAGTAEVSVVPHLYDLTGDHSGMLWLKSLKGNLVVLGWLYPRAIRWVLDRNGVKGKAGESLLDHVDESDADDEEVAADQPAPEQGIGAVNVPNRFIFAIDLRQNSDPGVYVKEIERLASSLSEPLIQLGGLFGDSISPSVVQGPAVNGTASNGQSKPINLSPFGASIGLNGALPANNAAAPDVSGGQQTPGQPHVIAGDDVRRRWYPVIDYSRCTNCMECLDFCLFGVYGVGLTDRILVEQEDNCKKGCPACSRVCPANAIVFPEHKTPAIAGAEGAAVEDFKIDLSKLFGAPSALEMAILERDTELVADGREAVGAAVGLPKRQSGRDDQPRDALDDLMDGLDSLDL